MLKRVFLLLLLLFSSVVLLTGTARAANFTVNNNADTSDMAAGNGICADTNGNCTLRAAVEEANALAGNDVIDFAASLMNATITLTNEIVIANNGTLIINGPGADKLTISGNNATRIFLTNAATATIKNVTLTGGNASAIGVAGGAVVLDGVFVTGSFSTSSGGGATFAGGSHQIINSTFSANRTNSNCGGFFVSSSILTVTNSTISGNTALQDVGGGFCSSSDTTLRNVTVSGNTAANNGGAIYHFGGTLNLANSIVAGNTGGGVPDIFSVSAVTTSGYNLIGDNTTVTATFPAGNPNVNNDRVGTTAAPINPLLAPLGDYGGTTFTHALLLNSPAINNGSGAIAGTPTADQRGAARVGATDIGAFELNNAANGGTFVAVLPNGTVSQSYSRTIVPNNVQNGVTYSYSVTSGTLPPGLSLTTNFALAETTGKEDAFEQMLAPTAVVAISGTPTTAGTYPFTITATGGGNSAATDYSIMILAPTAASVSISGQILAGKRGVSRAVTYLTDATGATRTALTNSFGYYRFDDVEVGQTYVFSISHKRYSFSPQVLSVTQEINDLNFSAN